jgi:hypothetical protein
VVGVIAGTECKLLSPQEGAYVNFLTVASSESEYRAKISGALNYYRLQLIEFQDVRPFSLSDNSSEEIQTIANELEDNENKQHVRYSTFHTFPRVM